ncbi:MAG: hypothetical protein IT210_16175 [Armatimonadetes bacterium]|nr:hypothetical protein [Armatimonadota bacterium]
MIRQQQFRSWLVLAGMLCVLLVSGRASAQVTLDAIVTANGTLFHYEYSVINGLADDLSIISFGVPQGLPAVQNLAVPLGFLADFDSGLGLVSFLEDTQAFTAGGTFSGFSFDSPFQPGSTLFSVLDVNGSSYEGTTQAPAGAAQTPVPEPSALSLLAAGLLYLPVRFRPRRSRGGNTRLR